MVSFRCRLLARSRCWARLVIYCRLIIVGMHGSNKRYSYKPLKQVVCVYIKNNSKHYPELQKYFMVCLTSVGATCEQVIFVCVLCFDCHVKLNFSFSTTIPVPMGLKQSPSSKLMPFVNENKHQEAELDYFCHYLWLVMMIYEAE